ncbi:UNVERIFIED_CONTAM: Kinesin-like protein KIN-14F [Sesamum latifolium]|uniref:Regulatory protein RecX n=1 Tax=Sesamum latifolium TaxID=2727402 RepID=A0AAW2WNM7_9LAMI
MAAADDQGASEVLPKDTEGEFCLALRNGLILCNVLNKVNPGLFTRYYEQSTTVVENPVLDVQATEGAAQSAIQYFENMRNFLVAVGKMKLLTFEASDLEKGGSSGKVVECILCLKGYHEWKQSGGIGVWRYGGLVKITSFMKESPSTGSSESADESTDDSESSQYEQLMESSHLSTESHEESRAANVLTFMFDYFSLGLLQASLNEINGFEDLPLSPMVIDFLLRKVVKDFSALLVSQGDQVMLHGMENICTRGGVELLDLSHRQLENIYMQIPSISETVSDGYNVCIFAYGQTGSGRRHHNDLAGSERVDKSEAVGERLKEAQHINRSLSALGDVIAALAQKSSHVPYRNSKLTQVLQDSLEVNALGETISTLKFAERVATINLGAAQSNKETSEIREFKEEISNLKLILERKEAELEQLKSCTNRGAVSPFRIPKFNSNASLKPEISQQLVDTQNIEARSCSSGKQRRPRAPSKFTDKDVIPKVPLLAEERSVGSTNPRSPSPPIRRSISTDRAALIRPRIKSDALENQLVIKVPFPPSLAVNKSVASVPPIVPSAMSTCLYPLGSQEAPLPDALNSLQRVTLRKIPPENEEEQFKQVLNVRQGGIRKTKPESKLKIKQQTSAKVQKSGVSETTLLSDVGTGKMLEETQKVDSSDPESEQGRLGLPSCGTTRVKKLNRNFSRNSQNVEPRVKRKSGIICCARGRDYSSSFPVKYIPNKSSKNEANEAVLLPQRYLNERYDRTELNVATADISKNAGRRILDVDSMNHDACSTSNISHGLSFEVEEEIEGDFMAVNDEFIEEPDVDNSSKRCLRIQSGYSRQDVEKSAIELLASRAFTAVELKKKLQGKSFPLEIVDAVITDYQNRCIAQNMGLINDCLHAETYSRSRWSSSSWGPRRIRQALFKKGVSEVDAEKVIKLVFENGEGSGDQDSGIAMSKHSIDQLYVQALKQWQRSHGAPQETRKSRIVRWLQYRGFNWSVIKYVLKKLESDSPS